jgi:hypothetical protein
MECHWKSADGRFKIAQIVLPRSKLKAVLAELHGGPSGGHLGVNSTLDQVRKRHYWLQVRDDVEEWTRRCGTCAASRVPRTRSRGRIHQYNGAFERIAVDVAGSLPQRDQRNRYLLTAMDYFTK